MSIREAWNASWDTNVSGTHVLTHTMAPLLLASASPRLLFITSGLSNLTWTSESLSSSSSLPANAQVPAGWPKPPTPSSAAYRASKTGLNMVMLEWTRLLKADGVKVFCISPGLLATGLGGNPEALKKLGAEDPKLGADFIRAVVEGERDADAGKVVRRGGVQPW